MKNEVAKSKRWSLEALLWPCLSLAQLLGDSFIHSVRSS